MDLENVLGQIKADCSNLHGGWLSFGSWLHDRFHNFGTLMPGAGAIHPICFGSKAGITHQLARTTMRLRKQLGF
jgi:hypothetical protein